jgi:hypothetical protein
LNKTKLLLLFGFLIGAIGVLILLNLIWVGFIDTPAKLELDKPYFLISNGFLVSILLAIALILVKVGRGIQKGNRGASDSELSLREDAYLIWRRLPIRERALSEIKKKYPDISNDQGFDAISKAESLNLEASEQAERFRSKTATKEDGISQLEKNHPGFPKSLYGTAWGYGMQDTR